jgi:hypothetical protein
MRGHARTVVIVKTDAANLICVTDPHGEAQMYWQPSRARRTGRVRVENHRYAETTIARQQISPVRSST